MFRYLTVGLAIVSALVLSASPVDASVSKAHLRHRLRAMTAERDALQRQLVSARSELGSANAQVAALQTQTASLKDTLNARTSQLDAIPTPLEAAEQYVSHEVEIASLTDPLLPRGELAALASMEYVESHVSFFQRSWRLRHGLPVPGDTRGYPVTANSIFTTQAGQCASHAFAFAALVRYLGYPVRSISFYYDDSPGTPEGHTSTEVYYDSAWHYFDPSFDLYWTDAVGNVLDITTVRSTGGIEHKADALLFNVIENSRDAGGSGVNDTWFETDPNTRIEFYENNLGG